MVRRLLTIRKSRLEFCVPAMEKAIRERRKGTAGRAEVYGRGFVKKVSEGESKKRGLRTGRTFVGSRFD